MDNKIIFDLKDGTHLEFEPRDYGSNYMPPCTCRLSGDEQLDHLYCVYLHNDIAKELASDEVPQDKYILGITMRGNQGMPNGVYVPIKVKFVKSSHKGCLVSKREVAMDNITGPLQYCPSAVKKS